jgi:hypothetical protein
MRNDAIPLVQRDRFIGFFEELAIMRNSTLINDQVTLYIFGYWAIQWNKSDSFGHGLNRKQVSWSLFLSFADDMERAQANYQFKSRNYHLRPPVSYRSGTDGVPQNDHAMAKPVLVDQLQLQPHTIREEPFSGAHDHWADDHLKLVYKRPFEHELRLVGNRVRGLPVDHRLVHPPPVEVGAD